MTERSVEDIVAYVENVMTFPSSHEHVILKTEAMRVLIADWRKRGDALKPFVELTADHVELADSGRLDGYDWFEDSDSANGFYGLALSLTWGDLRRARAALTPQHPPEKP